MLIDYKHLTRCPIKTYDPDQKAFVGDEYCIECCLNNGIFPRTKKVDCEFMDYDEGRKKMVGKMSANYRMGNL